MPDNDNELPRSKAEAKAIGSNRYFTGKACLHGHTAPRMVSSNQCVVCKVASTEAWHERNPEYLPEYRKQLYASNKEEILTAWAAWYAENHDRELEKKRKRYANNREGALEYAKEYREEHPDRIKESAARWRDNNPDKRKEAWQQWYSENGKEYHALKRSNPRAKVDNAISGAMRAAIRSHKAGRAWQSFVDYTLDDLMVHLEKQFQPGMSWQNYGKGGWHIDHIIPKSVFNYETPNDIDFSKCWALSNLQPLWELDNISKGAKLSKPFQPSLALAVNDNIQKEFKHG